MSIAGGKPESSILTVEPATNQATAAAHGHGGGARFVGLRTFAALRHRDFALLWSSMVCMSAGQWLQQVTISWIVFDMTRSASLLGLVNGLRMLPFLFTSLISGVLADRLDRRRLMLYTQGYLLVITLAMAVLLNTSHIQVWHLFAFTFISGLGWSFTMPVRQALLPALVPREDLMNAIALSSAAFNLSRVLGPAVGGFLLAALGGSGNFLVQAGAYAIVVAMVFAMRVPPLPQAAANRKESVVKSLGEGLAYIRTSPVLLSLLVLSLVPMLLVMPFQSLLPIFAADVYGIGAGGFGLLIAFAGAGSLASTLVVAGAGDFRRKGRVQMVLLIGAGVSLVAFGQVTWLPLAAVVLFVVGGFQMAAMTINQTLLQGATSDEMRGRVSSVYMLDAGLAPAGSFAAGAIASVLGAPATVTITGMLTIAIGILALLRLQPLRRL